MTDSIIKVGVVGGTGYTGVELLRLLVNHPNVRLTAITSRSEAGMPIAELFPSLRKHLSLKFTDPENGELANCDLVYFATPNGVAMKSAPQLLGQGIRIIDLAADFRLKNQEVWEHWYEQEHACPELLATAVYGLPEVNREQIKSAQLVANPGCYPTSVQLGLLPLLESNCIDTMNIIADCKSGVSGAGRKASLGTSLCEVSESFKAYAVPGHRHLPEIKQGLQAVSNREIGLVFVPHLVPMIRGIHATIYTRLSRVNSSSENTDFFQALFEQRYKDEPFVDVLPPGSHPDTRSVKGANHCRIAIHRPLNGDTLVILSVIDNLVKGAAGQAVQNMNIMFGLNESTGLNNPALLP
ncbi:MAG: N-acetyl-gamma-glutamyl-phosphate reductase [Gammaproteobacteria bacterium]|nr:N-acetyl-gamma-glutamyl-phosphate reductase [Gammaproteobacteria bacterium]